MTSDPTEPGRRQPDLLGREEDADIPPPPRGLMADPLDEEAEARLQRMSRRGRTLPALLVLVAIGAFVAIVWWAYRTANHTEVPAELPVVEAEPGDEKVRPESEGGLDVPNQDKLIYEQLGQGEQTPDVERLMPPPEEPLEPPAPPPVPDTAALTAPAAPQETPAATDPGEVSPEDTTTPAAQGEPAAEPEPEPEQETVAAAPPVVPAPEPAAPEAAAAPEPPAAEIVAEPAPEAAPAPAPEEPATQVAMAGAFRIQLASVKSASDADKEWSRLQKAHADLLGSLQPTVQRADLGAQGIFYRIQGGPLPNREAANSLCEQLKAKNQACLVVKP